MPLNGRLCSRKNTVFIEVNRRDSYKEFNKNSQCRQITVGFLQKCLMPLDSCPVMPSDGRWT
jgi:hypothetical protein